LWHALSALLLATPLAAQDRGVLFEIMLDDRSGLPGVGAVVSLLDASQRVIARRRPGGEPPR
jgi:hypothetical protein